MNCKPSTSLIITVFNNAATLTKCLKAVEKQTVLPDELIIADDGSTDPLIGSTIKDFASRFPKMIHVWHEDHGYQRSKILNRAITSASGDILIFTDSDCLPEKHFIEDHQRLCKVGCFCIGSRGCVKINHSGKFSPEFYRVFWFCLKRDMYYCKRAFRSVVLEKFKKRSFTNNILGANISCRREAILLVNGFDEQFNGWGEEDVDLVYRLIHLGEIPIYPRNLCITYHLDHPVRMRNDENLAVLEEMIRRKAIRAVRGIDSTEVNPPSFRVIVIAQYQSVFAEAHR